MARSSRKGRGAPILLNLMSDGFRGRLATFAVRLGLTLAVVTILCCCFVILRNYVSQLACYQVDTHTLAPKALPSWAGEGVKRDLALLPGLPDRFSIMAPGICKRIARSFERSPWVAEVTSVRKSYPNRIHVRMKLRRPVAGVLVGRKYYLVDASGRRLTGAIDRWSQGSDALPVILSTTRELPAPGDIWANEGVVAGAAVAGTLLNSREGLRTRFSAIDVGNVGGRRSRYDSEIVLVTHQGTRVKWGRSPLLVRSPGELTPVEKISKMIQFEKRRGPLSSYRYVDIRFDNVQHGSRVRLISSRGFDD